MVTNLMKYNPAFLGDEVLMRSFVARTSELEHILEVLRENTTGSNQHLLIIGPRGIGKTTLVLRTAAEIRADTALGKCWYPVVYGEETYQVSSAGEFWLEALFHVGQQTDKARWRQAYEELLGERNEERLRPRALAQLMDFADEQGKRLVLVVENLNMLFGGQIGDEDAWILRHTLMNEPRIMLLGTATSRFREMDEYNQALYELFRIIELEPLADDEAQAVWMAASGQTAPRHQLRPIQILTGGNPRLIRILSEFAAKTSFRSLMDDLTRLVDEHTEYFKHHLDNLPPQERKVFVVLADLWDPSTARQVAEMARLDVNVASAQLKRLVERGAVTTPYKHGRSQFYQVAERMYNIYHLMRRRGQPSSRVHAVVRFMVSLYRDEELIQTTRSLAEEAAQLTAEQRREHFLAYEAILTHTREPNLAKKLIEATRQAFEAMPDVPSWVRQLIFPAATPDQENAATAHLSDEPLGANLDLDKVDDIQVLLRIGDHLSSQPERAADAEAAYRKVLHLAPDLVVAWLKIGGLQSRNDQYKEALQSFDHVLMLDPGNALSWAGRGHVLSILKQSEEALDAFDHALALDAKQALSWVGRGMVLDQLGRTEEALQSLDRALSLDAEYALAWSSRGDVLCALGRVEEALACFDRSVSINCEDPVAWTNRGLALAQLGRLEEALASFDHSVEIDVENASTWRNRGTALYHLGRVEESLESFDRAVAMNPENASAWRNRGAALGRLERAEEALESFDRALALEPEDAPTWTSRGAALGNLKRLEEALVSFDRALTLDPESALAWENRSLALLDLGRTAEALESFERALTLPPEANVTPSGVPSGAWDVMAWAMFNNGPREKLSLAESWAQRAVEIKPENGSARHTLACILGAQGRWEQALEEAAVFLRDREFLNSGLEYIIDFFISAVASERRDEVSRVIQAAGAEDALEPLAVALHRLAGEQVDIAREILEISTDVIDRIETRRKDLQEAYHSE
jgi:tetratricopeptide (TPR) repeat protein